MQKIETRAVVRSFGAANEGVTARGGLFGTTAHDTAKAFVHVHGPSPLSTMNDIARAATVGAIAATLEGNLDKSVYADIALEGELMAGQLRSTPTLARPSMRLASRGQQLNH